MEKEEYVTIKGEDLEKAHWETSYGRTSFISHDKNGEKYVHEQFLPANLSVPKSLVQQPKIKIKMTQVEKDEFDVLKTRALTLIACVRMINEFGYPHLDERLHGNNEIGLDGLAQNEFALAWVDPSLIEVIPEKRWNVKIPPFEKMNKYYCKVSGYLGGADSIGNDEEDQQFTTDELKEYANELLSKDMKGSLK